MQHTLFKKRASFQRATSEEGVTAIEYGLIAALVAVAIVASAQALGTNVAGAFNAVATAIAGA